MANCDSYVILDVGGISYKTSRSTLTSFPDSILGTMFSEGGVSPQPDENGHYLIDRDGAMFRYILNFLRDKKLSLPSSFEEYDQLLAEADFYLLPDLRKVILSRLNPRPAKSEGKQILVVSRPYSTQALPNRTGWSCKVEAKPETWPMLKSLQSAGILETESNSCFPELYPIRRVFSLIRSLIGIGDRMESRYFNSRHFLSVYAYIIQDGFKLEGTVTLESEESFVFSACM